jgi:hypothetical protein
MIMQLLNPENYLYNIFALPVLLVGLLLPHLREPAWHVNRMPVSIYSASFARLQGMAAHRERSERA